MYGEVVEGIKRPHRHLQLSSSSYKRLNDGGHGLPSLFFPWQIFGVGLHVASDGNWHLLPGETTVEGGVPRVQGGADGGLSTNSSSGAARR